MVMRIGTNLTSIVYYSGALQFLNLVKQAGSWATRHSGSNTNEEAILATVQDANGYPTTLTGGAAHTYDSVRLATAAVIATAPYYPAGNYTCLYDGTGTLSFSGRDAVTVLGSSAGRYDLNIASPLDGVIIEITATDPGVTGDYVRNIRLVEAQYESRLTGGQIFHPTFLAKVAPFKVLRFMDWLGPVFLSLEVNWTDRRPFTYFTWASGADHRGFANGAPYEAIIALCNAIGADCHICIPINATDAYMTSMATLFHNSLSAPLKVYPEFDNELWLEFLGSGRYLDPPDSTFVAAARAASPTIDDGLGGGLSTDGQYGFYYSVIRSCKMADIWNSVWSGQDNARCQPVIASQLGFTNRCQVQLAYIQPAYFSGTAASHFKVFAGAPYFAAGVPVALAWTADVDGGLAKAFTEIMTGGVLPLASAAVTTGGTSTAFTLASGQSIPTTPVNGTILSVQWHATPGVSPTLRVDGGNTYPLNGRLNVSAEGFLSSGGKCNVVFTNTTSAGAVTPQWLICDNGNPTGGWLQEVVDYVTALNSTLAGYGLEHVCYEGGQSIVDYSHGIAVYQTFIDAMMRDGRMGSAYSDLLGRLRTAGITVFNHYNDIGSFSVYGNWSALEHVAQARSPRYDALVNFNPIVYGPAQRMKYIAYN